MDANKRRQTIISYAMFKNKINKVELAEYMEMSYPTMLSKLNNTDRFKLGEADKLCNILNINLTEFLTNK
jgi:DNA-binding Xre family transcriptional regulator